MTRPLNARPHPTHWSAECERARQTLPCLWHQRHHPGHVRRMRSSNNSSAPPTQEEGKVIILGVVLIVIGYLVHMSILITIGIIIAVVGAILLCISAVGHREIGGRRYWY